MQKKFFYFIEKSNEVKISFFSTNTKETIKSRIQIFLFDSKSNFLKEIIRNLCSEPEKQK